MTLSFQQQLENGEPTYFVEKTLRCLMYTQDIDAEGLLYRMRAYAQSLGRDGHDMIDIHRNVHFNLHEKLHTIRFLTDKMAEQWRKWAEEKKGIHFVINNRTPKRFQFAPIVPVQSVQKIDFNYGITKNGGIWKKITIDNSKEYYFEKKGERQLHNGMLEILAQNDGFETMELFFEYFNFERIDEYANKGKHPYIIHWTDLKY